MHSKLRQTHYHSKPILEELESRQLFSAGVEGLLTEPMLDPNAVYANANANPAPVAETQQPSAQNSGNQAPRNEIVFVDTRVDGYQTLLNDIKSSDVSDRNLEIIALDSNSDGIQQISQVLAERDNLDAVHIISHGSDGSLDLGNSQLNFDTLIRNQTDISAWGDSFNQNGDILLYGCNVAETQFGQSFVDYLAGITNTEIAASEDATGSADLGGDWQLEYQTGAIESQVAVSASLQQEWTDVLAVTANGTVTSTQATNTTSLTWSHTVSNGTDRALFVEIAVDGVGASVNSVKYGTADLVRVGRTAGNHAVEIWALVNPTVGTNNVVITFGGNTDAAAGASTFNGVDQTTPYGTYAGNSGTTGLLGGTGSVNVASATGDLVIDVQYWKDALASTAGTGQTSQWTSSSLLSLAKGGSSVEAGASSVTMSGSSLIAFTDWTIGAVSIKAATAAPVVTTTGTALSYTENTSTAVDNAITVTDSDSTNLVGATISISSGFVSGQDTLAFTNQNGITGSWNASTGILTLTGNATVANYQTALRSITYTNSSDAPNTATRTVSFVVNDGSNASAAATRTISITAVNDAPSDLYAISGVAESSLIGVYGFTNPSNLGRDAAGNNAPMTLYGNPGQTTGPSGSGALDLAGGTSGQYGDIVGITTGGAMTFAASVKFDSTGDWQRVFDFGQTTSGGIGNVYVGREWNTNNLTFTIEKNGVYTYRATANSVITNGSWLHFAATVDTSGNMKLYVNGNLAASTAGVALETGVRSNNFIGKSHWGGDAAFDGAIDNFVVANSVMTASQVAALYQQTSGFTVAENAANGTVIGTVVGFDVDASANPSYSLTDSAGGRFAISSSNGTLTVADGSLLNYEAATSHSVTVQVTDSLGASYSETYSVNLSNVVEAPSATNLSASETYTEDTALNLTDIVITRGDSATVTATLTLSNAAAGSLNTSTSGAVTSTYNAATGVWTASGAVADVNTLLAGLTFTPASNFNSNFTIATSVSDGVLAAVTGTKAMTGTAVNDAPVLTFISGNFNYPENYGAVIVSSSATVTDVDSANFDTGQMRVYFSANGQAEDRIGIQNQGSGAGQIGVSGTNVSYGGVVIGTYTGGTDGSTPLVVTFNANATVEAVQALARSITYQNVSDNPSTAVRTMAGYVTDGDGGTSNIVSGTLTIIPANDAPVISAVEATTLAYTENGAATAITSTLALTDVDNANLSSATISISGNFVAGQDVLAFTSQNGITGSWNATTGVLTLTGSASVANYQTALRSVTYVNTFDNPTTTTRTVSFTVNDGAANSNSLTRAISVASVNDAPSFSVGNGRNFTVMSGMQFGNAVTQQADGKYILVGWSDGAGTRDFAVARYNTDGTLDTSFGSGNGYVITAIGSGADEAQDVQVLANGKILVLGYSVNGVGYDVALVQYNADGTLDTSFGGGTGKAVSGLSGSDDGYSFAVQSDGKILVAGSYGNDFMLMRFNSNGSVDTSFGTSGVVTTDFSGGSDTARSMVVQADGKIVLAGQAYNSTTYADFAVARYNSNGSLDTSFNGTGKVTIDVGTNSTDQGYGVALQSDGKIVLSGFTNAAGTTDNALVRLNANGSLDTSFGGTGKVIVAIGSGSDFALDVKIQSDGKILTSGYSSGSGNDFSVVRYNSDGTLDTTFGGTGKVTTNFNATTDDRGTRLYLQGDGKIVVAGSTDQSGSYDLAIARYNSDGSLDTSFNATTNTLGSTISYTENAAAVVIDSDVQIFDSELSSSNFNGMTLSIVRNGGANSQDVFGASGSLATLTEGGNLTVGGVIIGTVTTNSNGTLLLTFNSNATNTLANSAIRQITYRNTSDAPPASVQLNWTLNDANAGTQGSGGALTGSGITTVNITAVNDAPVISAVEAASLAYTENASATVVTATLTLADLDNANLTGATVQITGNFATGQDVLAFSDQNGITGSWNATTGTLTLSGSATVAQYQTALRSVTYQNTSDTPSTASRTVSFSVTDGTTASNVATRSIAVTAVNDAPTFSNLNGTPTFIENGAAVVLDADVSLFDTELSAADNFSGATLTLARHGGANADDALAFDGITVTVSGTDVFVSGVQVGTYTFSGGQMDITFGANATSARVNTLMRNIVYWSWSDAPPASVQIDWTFSDANAGSQGSGGTLTATGSTTVSITAVNDAPVLSAIEATTLAYTENGNATAITATLALSDADNANLTGATVQITGNYASGQDVLALSDQNGITGSWDSNTGTLTLSGSASVAQYQSALRSVTYQNTSDAPSTASRTVSFSVTDSTTSSNTVTRSLSVAAVNDAPTATITPASYSATEQTSLTLHGTGLSIADVDAGSASVQATLSVVSGTLTASAGTTGVTVSGSGTSSITLTGSLSQINNLLAGNASGSLSYIINSDTPPASDTLTLSVNDQGNTGSGGALTGFDVATIDITAVNDAPVNTVYGDGTIVPEDSVIQLLGSVVIADADSGSGTLTTTLSVSAGAGVLSAISAAGVTISGSGTNTLTLSGDVASINAFFASAATAPVFTATADYNGAVSFTVVTTDNGNSGSGGALSDSDTISGSISAVADIINDSVTTNEDTPVTFNPLANDTFENAGRYISAIDGTSVSSGQTVAITGGNVTLNANGSLTFTPTANSNGATSFSYTVTSGVTTETATVALTINPVNDAPVLTSASLTLNEGQTVTLTAANFGVTDPDNSSFTYTLSSISGGYFQLTTNPGVAVTSFTTAQLGAGQVQFVDDGNEVAPSFSVTVSDGSANSNTLAATVNYTAVNDAPTDIVATRYLSDQSYQSQSMYDLTINTGHSGYGIVLDGVNYARGLGTHPGPAGNGYGYVDYAVNGATSFKATIGINDYQTGLYGSVRFYVYVDGVQTYSSGVLDSASTPIDLNISVAGASTIRLAVDNANNGNAFDHGVWANARLEGGSVALSSIAENAANGAVVGTVVGLDNDPHENWSYALTDNAGGRFAINTATGQITVADGSLLNYEAAASHNITVRATDTGGLSVDKTFTLSLTNVNEAPVINSASLSLNEGDTVTLSAANFGVTDPDNSSFTYTVSSVSGGYFQLTTNPAVSVTSFTSAQLSAGQVQFVDDGNEVAPNFSVTVNDGALDSNTLAATINYTAVNDNAPVISSGSTASVNENSTVSTVVYTASGSDADGNALTWSLSGTDAALLSIDATTGAVTLNAPADYETKTSYSFNVVASDGTFSSNQAVTLAVHNLNDNAVVGPTDANNSVNTVAENAANGTVVGITALASDADTGATISYSLTDNAGGRFAIDSTTGVVTVADGSLLDYETATSHSITVLATSSDGSTNSQTFSIAVTNVNDNPVSAVSDSDTSLNTISENAANGTVVGITALASDADTGATLSYSLTDNAGGRFAIDSTTGVVTVANGSLLDYETATSHSITVLATSSDGSTNSQTFSIAVTNVNDNPVSAVSDSDTSLNTISENAANGTVVGITALASDADTGATISYSLTDNAGGRFAIDSTTGVVTVADGSLLDYETATSHSITVLATSSDGSTNSQTFSIAVTNVNDNPVSAITDSNATANSVAENAANGTVVGITALASDADTGATISYSLTDNAGGRFAIDSTTGVVTVANGSLLDYETATSHSITVLATSSDGSTNSQTFSIAVTNVNDNPVSAVSDSDTSLNTISENAANGTVVGITALASDADTGATLSYSLTDNAGGRFAIDSTTGVVTVANGSLLDYETATSHSITVLATSSDGSTNSQSFTIAVSNLNDNPVSTVSDSNATANSVAENAATGTVVGVTALASDADAGATISYSLTDNAGGRFAIDSTTGVVTVADGSLLDYETATSHSITVLATSSDGSTNTESFTINLSNLNDNPVGTLTDSNATINSVAENAANGTVVGITALATDADSGTTLSYSLSDNAGGRFAIDSSTGVITVADGSLLDYETATSHSITVLATSSDGSTNSQSFTIAVSNLNDNPVNTLTDSNATANSVAENAASGTVVGVTALATDADSGATLSYSLTDNAGGRFAIDSNTGVVTVADGSLLDYETATSHSITVLATSSDGSTNSQSFTINVVNLNDNPVSSVSDSNSTANSVAENAANGALVGITALATDADSGASISYSLSDNAGGRFAIDSSTGVVTVADGSLLDYESATSHSVTVLATSSDGSTNSQTFSIAVTNVNDNPVSVVTDSNATVNSVTENAANGAVVGITALATDADSGATISYSLSDDAGGRFAIDTSTGVVTVADGSLLDYETATSHSITVLATSSDGSSNSQSFTIAVTNLNDNPVSTVSDSNATANSVAENAANGTVVGITALATDADSGATISYSLSDDAGGRFAIDSSTGVVTVADGSLLDYESATSHSITVLATSSDGSTNTESFTINLSNLNDNPVGTLTDSNATINSVAENAANGTVVGITALATDADSGTTISYSLTDDAGGRFAIDSSTGVVTVADGSLLDYETATSHSITVLATSSDGSTNSQTFSIAVTNVNDNPVSIITDSDTALNTISENAANGTVVGITALASDADAGATISYSLSDDAGGRFAIDSSTGIVTVADGSLLDYETATSHSITVLATSSDGSTNSQTFSIAVTNVNDNAPVLSSANMTLSEGQTVTLAASNFGVNDPDNTSFSYIVSNVSGGYFQIASNPGVAITSFTTAQLVADQIQFVDDGDEVTPSFSVTVNDGALESNTVAATINYTGVNDAPVIGSATLTLSQGQTVTLSAANFGVSDPDSASFTYTVSSVSGGYFQLTGNPGASVTSFSSAQLAAGQVQFVDDGNEVVPNFSVTVNDGGASSNLVNAEITYSSSDDKTNGFREIIRYNQTNGSDRKDQTEQSVGDKVLSSAAIFDQVNNVFGESVAVTQIVNNEIEGINNVDILVSVDQGSSEVDKNNVKLSAYVQDNLLQEQRRDIVRKQNFQLKNSALEQYSTDTESVLSEQEEIEFWNRLDHIRQQMSDPDAVADANPVNVKIILGTSASLTAGFVSWILRAGSLMASFMSTVPLLKRFDPLPVLRSARKDADSVDGSKKDQSSNPADSEDSDK
ncbi:cadherin domain-containing protein [Methylomonas sp. EFPC3]|uniref:cadherin domain-containing protein n=1 Tax=Methylomonas sp. EFPC3 TaxID=3021710 RepID=UPI002417D848|nr:cadherin domain-containing protein [Methylomonas sp. EFPC3]WFP52110.1 cadherin domain-containing protein [Methylomonas sp. EFPC3]